VLEVPLVQFMTVPLCGGAAAGDSCCDVCRVEFRTQEDDEIDSSASKDSRELVMAAQTIFQMGGAIFFALLDLEGVASRTHLHETGRSSLLALLLGFVMRKLLLVG
jgi:hypothetical protein